MVQIYKFLFFLPFLLQHILGANILFMFGGGNYSHKHAIWPLVMALTQKGHNVTFVSSVKKQPTPNSKVVDITPKFMKEMTAGVYEVDRFRERRDGTGKAFVLYEELSLSFCSSMLNSKDDAQFTNLIEHEKFDVVVVNAAYGDCALYLAQHLSSKYVIYGSTTVFPFFHGIFGIPLETSWITDVATPSEYPMSFWTRLRLMYSSWRWHRPSAHYDERLRQLYKNRFGLEDAEAPQFIDVARNAALVLINTHHAADFPRSLPPMFIHIGGMQCWDEEGVLPQNFKEFMDGADDGVILISFGSTIVFNKLSEQYLSIFFNMMRKFNKVRFIWRWEGPLPAGQPENLLGAKWLPQREILREKSLKALMTHGGMSSQHEAAYYGVPMIVMPLFADQDFQAYRIKAQEIGVMVEAAEFSQEMLDDAVWKILNIPTYTKNMEMRSKVYRDRPNPTQTGVEALEFVLRHDDLSVLKPMALEQSWWVRQHVDIYFFCFFVLTIFNLLVPYILWRVCKTCFY